MLCSCGVYGCITERLNSNMLEQLQQLDIALLTDLVRQDQRSPSLEILDWSVKPLSQKILMETTGGLFCFSGQERNGGDTTPWSMVLKILTKPQNDCLAPREWCYWKREMLAFQSGFLAGLSHTLAVPRYYGTMETANDAWIWMDHIIESTGKIWEIEQFQIAARQAGRFAGVILNSVPLPAYPWLSEPFFRSLLDDGGWWANLLNPESPNNVWESPVVQGAFTETLRSQVKHIWAEKHHLLDILDRLPQVFCHNDFHRRNLMIRKEAKGGEELVALDWALCGPGAIGSELAQLIGASTASFDADLARFDELEATVLQNYLAELRNSGWYGDPQIVRLAYLLSVALWPGSTLPGWVAYISEGTVDTVAMYGHSADEVMAGWVTLCELLMERADEARHLIRELNF
jgi:hypothetical protein